MFACLPGQDRKGLSVQPPRGPRRGPGPGGPGHWRWLGGSGACGEFSEEVYRLSLGTGRAAQARAGRGGGVGNNPDVHTHWCTQMWACT